MSVAAVALLALLPARGAWTTGRVVDTPSAWGVGAGAPSAFREPPPCPTRGAVRAARTDDGVVRAAAGTGGGGSDVLTRLGGWSREVAPVVHLVPMARDRIAVFSAGSVIVMDAKSGADVAPALALESWPTWVSADGDRLLVRAGNALMAIEVPALGPMRVLWRDASAPARHDAGALVKCGERWIDVVVRREIPGHELAKSKAVLAIRVIDAARGVIGERAMRDEPGFFDMAQFEASCSATGRIDVVGRFIILD